MQLQIPSQHIQILPKSDWACKMTTICYSWFSFSSRILWSWPFWFCAELLIRAIHSTPLFHSIQHGRSSSRQSLPVCIRGEVGGEGRAAPALDSLQGSERNTILIFQRKKKPREVFFPTQFYLWSLYTPQQYVLIMYFESFTSNTVCVAPALYQTLF